MRSYTNKNNEIVEVNEEHLKVATRLKRELQMASPSHRASWSLHKTMMEKEGYFDSENSEAYRCLIKGYQKSIGELPSVTKYAELVSESKLQSVKDAIGDMYFSKREIQLENLSLQKIKRELADKVVFTKSIIESFNNIEIRKPNINPIITGNKSREMLVLPSDWHVGYINDTYDYKKSVERIDSYVSKIIEYSKVFDVDTFHVVHLGDICENLYMHKNTQSFNAEFTFAEQIVKSVELLFYLIESLSLVGKVIFHGVIRGNHGRMSAKGETISKDCAEFIAHEWIKKTIEKSERGNIVIDESGYNIERSIFTVKGKVIKAVHGDKDSQNDRAIIQKHISLENTLIDVLCMGHFHNFRLITENFNRVIYQSGCLQGATDFSKSLKFDSPSSQGIIIISEDEVTPINIILQ